MAPVKQLQVSLVPEAGGWTRLCLSGPLNEEAKEVLTAQLDSLGAKLVLDFGGVTQLNSSGIRDWSIFLKQLKNRRTVEFDQCPEEVVRAINMVPNFVAGLPIRSVQRHYSCDDCKSQHTVVFNLGRDYQPGEMPKVATKMCQRCGNKLEPAEPDEEFFIFLSAP